MVFLDISMPGTDCYGVGQKLCENEATAATKLIAITGYGSEEDRQRAHASGFNYIIVKPAVLMELLANGV